MKVLCDPIFTAAPSRCSCFFKHSKIVETMLSRRDDVFFYVMIPDNLSEEEKVRLPVHDNVRYIPRSWYKDRVREYITFSKDLDSVEAFNGDLWDFDTLLTARSTMIPLSRMVMNSPRTSKLPWLKQVILIEEMFMMGFRPTVPVLDLQAQEIMVLNGYLNSDAVYIQTPLEEKNILRTAKQYFSPAIVQSIAKKLVKAIPNSLTKPVLKNPKFRYGGNRKFCLAYTSRMENTISNLEDVYDVMVNSWIVRGDLNLRLLICTVSTGIKQAPPKFVELRHPSREEFWQSAREEMDLYICLHKDMEYSLSLTEPMILGVPLVCIKAPWSIALFGPDYPFYVENEVQAYTTVRLFYSDYDKWYARFAEWQQAVFAKMLAPGGVYGQNIYDDVCDHIESFEKSRQEKLKTRWRDGIEDRLVVSEIMKQVEGRKDFVIFDVIRELAEAKVFTALADKTETGDRDRRGLVWATSWPELRLMLQNVYGLKDASTAVGHLTR